MLSWSKIEDPRNPKRERYNAIVMTEPDVVLQVEQGENGVEWTIYAVFHWPGRPPKPLILNRDVTRGNRAMEMAKLAAVDAWGAEHVLRGEDALLREMWRKPNMTATEIEELEQRYARMRNEAKERAGKIIHDRASKLGKGPKS